MCFRHFCLLLSDLQEHLVSVNTNPSLISSLKSRFPSPNILQPHYHQKNPIFVIQNLNIKEHQNKRAKSQTKQNAHLTCPQAPVCTVPKAAWEWPQLELASSCTTPIQGSPTCRSPPASSPVMESIQSGAEGAPTLRSPN